MGSRDITMIITDNKGLTASQTFNLIVYEPPSFDGKLPKQLDLIASNPGNFTLPIITDI